MGAYAWHASVSNTAYVSIVEAGTALLRRDDAGLGWPEDLVDEKRPDLGEYRERIKQKTLERLEELEEDAYRGEAPVTDGE
jgi:hypothetical protein